MALVHSTLPTKYNLEEMEIGDTIPCEYTAPTSGQVGTFQNLGAATKDLNSPESSATPDGSFYFIKVDKGLLIADRVVQHSISWDSLNEVKMIEGEPWLYDGTNTGLIRSLTGGVAYLDSSGGLATTDQGLGAYPPINEWDKYIVKSDLGGKITPGDDNVWHKNNNQSYMQETPISAVFTNIGGQTKTMNSTQRILRGWDDRTDNDWKGLSCATTSGNWSSTGFRPVLQLENDKQTTMWY